MADELERKYDVKILSTEEKVKYQDALKVLDGGADRLYAVVEGY